MIEINKINEYENIKDGYFIDEKGVVYSFRNKLGRLSDEHKILKQYKKTGGYLNVALVDKNNKVKYIRVHRIVANAFIENKDNKQYVNHIDENRTNNNVNNLEWVTPKENNHHSLLKKVYVYDLEGNHIKTYKYTGECVDDGFNQGHVCSCARNEIRNHKKHIFSYEKLTKNDVVQRLSKPYYLNDDNRRK
ncbi:MAG: HNH endonuclease [Sarcina sp.]